MFRVLGSLLVAFLFGVSSATAQEVIPLNSSISGAVKNDGDTVVFRFDALQGLIATLSITGQNGLAPVVRLIDPSDGKLIDAAVAPPNGKATISKLVLPITGEFEVEVSGSSEGLSGSFTGTLSAKLPKSMKSAQFAKNAAPGSNITFFALAGTRLDAELDVKTKPHPMAAWVAIVGPSGPVDFSHNVFFTALAKHASIKKLTLPVTGLYTVTPTVPTLVLAGKVKLTPPKSTGGAVDVGSVLKLAPVAMPTIDALPLAVKVATVTVTGSALGAKKVEIVAHPANVVVDVINNAYSAVLPLATNALNVIQATALDEAGRRSLPAVARIIHDSDPPILGIVDPLNNQGAVGTKFTVTGVVGDRLTGDQGITVTVNGLAADVEPGGSGLGSFERRDIALGVVSTTVTVIAKDILGNQVTKSITVKKTSTTGQNTIGVQSGDAQTAIVGQILPQPIVARVVNSLSQPLSATTVTFRVAHGDAALGATSGFGVGTDKLQVTTDANGDAIAFVRLGSEAGFGSTRIVATASGALGVASFTTHANAGTPKRIAPVGGLALSAPAGVVLADALSVRVTDGLNPVPNQAVRFRVLKGGGSFSAGAEIATTTNVLGVARTDFRLGTSVDVQRVEASLINDPTVRTEFSFRTSTSVGGGIALTGMVLDPFERGVVNATATLFLNGAQIGSVLTDSSGRYTFEGLPSGGSARVVLDGSTATGVSLAGGVTATSYPFGSLTVRDISVLPIGKTVCSKPAVLPGLSAGATTYTGAAAIVMGDPSIEDFNVTLASGTIVTLANGLTVPGLGGSVAIRFAPLGKDDMPAPLPDGAEFAVGFVVEPPFISFNGPLSVELPDVLGVGKGGRAVLLQYDAGAGRMLPVAELSSDGAKLTTDVGTGLARSGYACVVVMSRPLTTVFDCAGTRLAELSHDASVNAKTLKSDSASVTKLDQIAAEISTARSALVEAVDLALEDLALNATDWNKLRSGLGKLEVPLIANQVKSSDPFDYVALASLEDELPGAIAEAQVSGCGTGAATAASALLSILTNGADDALDSLAIAAAARGFAKSVLDQEVEALRSILIAPAPTTGIEAKIDARVDAIVAAEASFQAANAAFTATLSGNVATDLLPAVTSLASEVAVFPAQPTLVGASLNGSSAIGWVGSSGGLRLPNVPVSATGARHAIDAMNIGVGPPLFGRSPRFEAIENGSALSLPIPMAITPPVAPALITIAPATCVVDVGSSKQLTVQSVSGSGVATDVTTQASGTDYRGGNSAIVEIGTDGNALAKAAGQTYVTAENSNAIGVRKFLALGIYSVTITGTVSNGTGPAAGATIYGPNGVTATTLADGSFTLPLNLSSDKATFDIVAAGTLFGAPMYASVPVTVESSGPLNVGSITLLGATNLALSKSATVLSGSGSVNNALSNMLNGVFLAQGSGWTSGGACWWQGTTQIIEIDLAGKFVLASGICQGDNNDTYLLEYLDAVTQQWKTLWGVPDYSSFGGGLQTRPNAALNTEKFVFSVPVVGTKLRIRATGGDGSFSISELQVYGVSSGN